ncbi:hypothetical protein [Pseudomonas siliginis]|uniref:DUF551 domain-containing protein n=1 Tax=Pseudomonas siliginis TaxID=2842346 RepID=A0ABY5C7Q5_9PSED|nr:hypothetical protein [Pseudomonas siliginis]UST83310.1 hypothetical protein NF677_17395 [Pseudomonas siliginis]
MKLNILRIADAGDLEKERIVLRAATNVDIGEFLLLQARTVGEKITTDISETYWFPDKEISSGDLVILYTKKGRDKEKETKEGKSHFFYWHKTKCVWSKEATTPIILNAPFWDTLPE